MRFSTRIAPSACSAPRSGRRAGVTSRAAGAAGIAPVEVDERRRVTVPGQANDAVEGDLADQWRRVQQELRSSVTESAYGIWFAPLRPHSARWPVLYLTGPRHVRRWVARRYPELLRAALAKSGGSLREVVIVPPGEDPPEAGEERAPSADEQLPATLNPSYTFERFVIGDGNRFAHAAALAVAESPGQAYNPLFLHGPPGLGKTHLMGAIANYLHVHSPELAVHYTTAEAFTNEFVAALRGSGIDGFKRRYRHADVLLIDDVQFLEGKSRTAEEFFHTFNALYEGGAQLVFTADRLPGELSDLAERLRQRFEWGLTVSLDPPDLSTRLIFLANLVRERSESIAPEALREIASRAAANLRVLEGALTRVLALSSLTASAITPEVVEQALPGGPPRSPGGASPSVESIQDEVSRETEISRETMLSPARSAPVARARQIAMYLTREHTDLSLPEIARAFNRRDHTTVMHALKRVEQARTEDPRVNRTLEALERALSPPPAAAGAGPTGE
ncbi:MAG: chromosomal replication initiator protein DnaA [Actinobacteria bacterium]|nr:chromosomal replication initiator protein DnaA [Actinomycetota bacterium]